MFFDDRLATVLRQRAQSDAMRRTQYRQLLDLLGAPASTAEMRTRDPSLVAAAWLRMDSLAGALPSGERARLIREPGWRFRNPELAAHLADFEPEVASAALARAQLSEDDWKALIPRLPVRARGFLRLRSDLPLDAERLLERLGVYDRGLPQPERQFVEDTVEPDVRPEKPTVPTLEHRTEEAAEQDASLEDPVLDDVLAPLDLDAFEMDEDAASAPVQKPVPAAADPNARGRSEISALVERIAQFKRSRESAGGRVGAFDEDNSIMPRLPLGEDKNHRARAIIGFGFAADAAGRIEWAEIDVAAMVIGARLVAPTRLGEGDAESPLTRAFNRRQPIRAAAMQLSGAEAIAGKWIVDAQPRFTDGGSFAGYVGRFRRPPVPVDTGPSPAEREADRIRQLLHELRTPVTAVQGYSEVIQQQLFGSAPHEYRALAAAIASDAARILSGFEELDRLAKLETGVIEIDPGETDLAALALRTVRQLAQVLDSRMAGIELALESEALPAAAIDPESAEALLWRLLATLGGGCAAGESLDACLETHGDALRLTCELPAQLLSETDIFAAEARPIGTAINTGLFGAGFALRLARAEARAARGDLVRSEEAVILTLPRSNSSEREQECGPERPHENERIAGDS